MKLISLIVASFLICSCTTLMPSFPGAVTKNTSDYDGTTSITLNPGWAGNLKIGVRTNSKLPKDKAILIVRSDLIKNFDSRHPNFFVKIAGEEKGLSPLSRNTECEISSSSDVAHCTQEYMIEIAYLKTLLESKDVKFKLNLRDSYLTGNLNKSGPTTARSGLSNFFKELNASRNIASP
jgi:hypothetical protein